MGKSTTRSGMGQYSECPLFFVLNSLTGKKPNKSMVVLLSCWQMGLASDEDVIQYLNKKDNTGIKLQAKAEAQFKKWGV